MKPLTMSASRCQCYENDDNVMTYETDDNAMKPKITHREVQTNVNMPHPTPPQPPHLSRSINFKNRSSHTFGFTPVGINIVCHTCGGWQAFGRSAVSLSCPLIVLCSLPGTSGLFRSAHRAGGLSNTENPQSNPQPHKAHMQRC